MKHLFGTLACILLISLVSSSLLAGEDDGERNRFGVGISLFEEFLSLSGPSYSVDLTGGVNVYLPVRLRENVRIEPEFGIMYTSYDYEYDGESYDGSERIIRIGIGIMPIIQRGKLDMYYGLRLGVSFASLKEPERTIYTPFEMQDYSKTDWYIAPAFGSEFFVSPHFSVGGEVRLEFTSFGEWNDSGSTSDLYTIQNRNLFFVRWYF